MKLLASIRPKDVDPDAPTFDYRTFKPRPAVRAVIFDGDKVALIHVSKPDYYMLPGGGIENDDVTAELAREIMEELGCKITIDREVGNIDVYFDRWKKRQTDLCYVAHKTGEVQETSLIELERDEGFETVWAADLADAIRLVRDAKPQERDGKLVRTRDLLFLEAVAGS